MYPRLFTDLCWWCWLKLLYIKEVIKKNFQEVLSKGSDKLIQIYLYNRKQPLYMKKAVSPFNVFVMNRRCFVKKLFHTFYHQSFDRNLSFLNGSFKKDSKGMKRYFSRLLCGRLISRKKKERNGGNAFRFRISLKDSTIIVISSTSH